MASVALGLAVASFAAPPSPVAGHNPYNYSHVRLVETAGRNWLFRGGIPINATGGFAYAELSATFAQRAAEAGRSDFPAAFHLVDISFLHSELADIAVEKAFFDAHPQLGELWLWPVSGVKYWKRPWDRSPPPSIYDACHAAGVHRDDCPSAQPRDFKAGALAAMTAAYLEWGDSDLPRRLNATRRAPLAPRADGAPLVLYGHCECGCDRTGEFFAAYQMAYMNRTFVEAMTFDTTVPNRHISYQNQAATQWYCHWLAAQGGAAVSTADCNACDAPPFARCKP